MLTSQRTTVVAAVVFLLQLGFQPLHAQTEPQRDSKDEGFVLRLLDEDGKPVAEANVGFSLVYGNANFTSTGWEYYYRPGQEDLSRRRSATGVESDKDGIARFSEGRQRLAWFGVVARHPGRKLVAVEKIAPESASRIVTVTMKPECHVFGELTCNQLEEIGGNLSQTSVTLYANDRLALEYWSKEPVFHFYLPPGNYEVQARSHSSGTHGISRSIVVPKGQKELDLGRLDLPLSKLRLLQGKPAPELRDVVAWKGEGPRSLADLRGKVVLLDFWGVWCAACIEEMPHLFELHDKYHDKGLVIIGIHQDAGDGIDSAQKLDKAMAETREKVWRGRDFPFPIGFVRHNETPLTRGASGSALNRFGADYGVGAAAILLIDRQGRLVGEFYPVDEHIQRLEKLLADKDFRKVTE